MVSFSIWMQEDSHWLYLRPLLWDQQAQTRLPSQLTEDLKEKEATKIPYQIDIHKRKQGCKSMLFAILKFPILTSDKYARIIYPSSWPLCLRCLQTQVIFKKTKEIIGFVSYHTLITTDFSQKWSNSDQSIHRRRNNQLFHTSPYAFWAESSAQFYQQGLEQIVCRTSGMCRLLFDSAICWYVL